MFIDFHTHIFPPQIRENRADYSRRDPYFGILFSNPRAKLASAEELIASMDTAGIEASVILNFGWRDLELCIETNDYILECIHRFSKRLIGFCTVPPMRGEAAVREVERCVRGGIRGIGELMPEGQGYDLADKEVMAPLTWVAMRYHLPILCHASEPVGHQYPGKGKTTPEVLYRFITHFPHQPLIFAHWGGGLPFYGLMPEVAAELRNVYFDTAASRLLYRPEIFHHITQIVGAEKVLFGSDYPLLSQEDFLEEVRSLDLPWSTLEALLGGNAWRLLGLRDVAEGIAAL